MSQNIIEVKKRHTIYAAMHELSTDIVRVLSDTAAPNRDDFDQYIVMCNLLSRGTFCMGNILLLIDNGSEHDAGNLARHLSEIVAVTAYVYKGDRVDAFIKQSHTRYEKLLRRLIQLGEKHGTSPERLAFRRKLLRDISAKIRNIGDISEEKKIPRIEEVFTSDEFAELLAQHTLDREFYTTMHQAPSTMFVHTSIYSGGSEREKLLGRKPIYPPTEFNYCLTIYWLLIFMAVELLDKWRASKVVWVPDVGRDFSRRLSRIKEHILSNEKSP